MLTIKNVSVQYENKMAVDKVSLNIESGRITGLIGINGAGKSSLLKSLVGLIPDFKGGVDFDGKDLRKDRFWVKEHCGYAPEDAELLPYLKGRELLQLIAAIRKIKNGQKDIDLLLNLFSLQDVAGELTCNYSHGMIQKLSLAAALIGRPQWLVLDEALNGLDPLSLRRLKEYFFQLLTEKRTIVLSSHILSLIREWCDPIVIFHQGKVLRTLSRQQIELLEIRENKKFDEIFLSWTALRDQPV